MGCRKGWRGVGTGGTDGTGRCGLGRGGTDCTNLLFVLLLQQVTSVWCFRSFLFRLGCLSVPFFPMCCSSHIMYTWRMSTHFGMQRMRAGKFR